VDEQDYPEMFDILSELAREFEHGPFVGNGGAQ
jgi:hypothetical protein